ncbi:MAG TPA: DotU family type IV/VI secretion system protein [Terriglobia bacterium]|nr:DotU family type IV/VI secretion system protein [Terriglobia bacterium]
MAAPTVPTRQPTAPAAPPRTENLALLYQEMFTVTVRVRSNRQVANDAASFRVNMRSALKNAEQQALAKGYHQDEIRLATFAVVAFLDESVLTFRSIISSDWEREPLGQGLFGSHLAGELFFQGLDRLLKAQDSPGVADALEVYLLCLLLGYRGKYGLGGAEATRSIQDAAIEKIRRIRGAPPKLTAWVPPEQSPSFGRHDPWIRRLALAALVTLVLTAGLFVAFKLALSSSI